MHGVNPRRFVTISSSDYTEESGSEVEIQKTGRLQPSQKCCYLYSYYRFVKEIDKSQGWKVEVQRMEQVKCTKTPELNKFGGFLRQVVGDLFFPGSMVYIWWQAVNPVP